MATLIAQDHVFGVILPLLRGNCLESFLQVLVCDDGGVTSRVSARGVWHDVLVENGLACDGISTTPNLDYLCDSSRGPQKNNASDLRPRDLFLRSPLQISASESLLEISASHLRPRSIFDISASDLRFRISA